MDFGLFFFMQTPKPWDAGSDHRVHQEALEQVELADRLGFATAWAVEHHFMEDYSHSAAPEVFLAAAAGRTQSIRLGHGIVQLMTDVNHPARVAERIAVLDLVSDGRVEFGTGEGTGAVETPAFGTDLATKREEWRESLDVIMRLFAETPFRGVDGRWTQMPVRNLVPKPLQAPHPPLWVAAPRQSAVELAAEIGAGALCLSLDKEPADAAELVAAYERVLQSEACVPAGHAVNPRLAFVLPMLCHADEATALDRGLDSAQFFLWALMYYLLHGSEHAHGEADLLAEFHRQRAAAGWDRSMVAAADGRLRASFDRSTPFGVRGAIGTPGQLRELLRGYEEAGADQVTFLCQVGDNRHEHICESMELFAREVMPEFAERHADREARKRERLAGAIDAALARRVDLTAPAAAVAAASADGTLDGYYGEAPQVVR